MSWKGALWSYKTLSTEADTSKQGPKVTWRGSSQEGLYQPPAPHLPAEKPEFWTLPALQQSSQYACLPIPDA